MIDSGPLTTHVLDTTRGVPAARVPITLEVLTANKQWKTMATGTTDGDGRAKTLLPPNTRLEAGIYRLTFDTEGYFRPSGIAGFYPHVTVTFTVREATNHLHVPLLLSPYGYSTYRGS